MAECGMRLVSQAGGAALSSLPSLVSLALPQGFRTPVQSGSFARRGAREGKTAFSRAAQPPSLGGSTWNFNGCRLEEDANPPCLTHWPGHGCFWCKRSLVGDLSLAILASTRLLVWDPALGQLPEYLQRQGLVPLRTGGKGEGGWHENGVLLASSVEETLCKTCVLFL